MNEEQKQPYIEKETKDQQRYEKQLAEFLKAMKPSKFGDKSSHANTKEDEKQQASKSKIKAQWRK